MSLVLNLDFYPFWPDSRMCHPTSVTPAEACLKVALCYADRCVAKPRGNGIPLNGGPTPVHTQCGQMLRPSTTWSSSFLDENIPRAPGSFQVGWMAVNENEFRLWHMQPLYSTHSYIPKVQALLLHYKTVLWTPIVLVYFKYTTWREVIICFSNDFHWLPSRFTHSFDQNLILLMTFNFQIHGC